ncbi:GDSL-type esterase/lipase family protein [Parahaliea mediterranea]|uniref:GDSL-type esterase/lipase family protein n=1 Tax=Parahaliea mediterranea TaxID=651086 RepID=UPI0019D4C760|nr:GDSL-type esterase/lipase family protein [Parahaliea mediterranea]
MQTHTPFRLMQRFSGILLCLLLSACAPDPTVNPIPPGATVMAFGDSITFGTGAAAGESYPDRLAALNGWRMVNAGVPGDTAQGAGERLGDALTQHQPALVILELGGNDFLRRRPASAVKEDLRGLIRQVKAQGIPLALVAVPRFSVLRASVGTLDDAALYRELAEEEQVFLVQNILARILSDETLRADPIHPNAAGYRQLARQLHAALAEAGFMNEGAL